MIILVKRIRTLRQISKWNLFKEICNARDCEHPEVWIDKKKSLHFLSSKNQPINIYQIDKAAKVWFTREKKNHVILIDAIIVGKALGFAESMSINMAEKKKLVSLVGGLYGSNNDMKSSITVFMIDTESVPIQDLPIFHTKLQEVIKYNALRDIFKCWGKCWHNCKF